MRKGNRGSIESLLLALEALLVIIGLSLGSGTQMVMSCYWVIILVYHICEWVQGVERNHDDEEVIDDGQM